MVIILGASLSQVTMEVISSDEPSEYVPIAVKSLIDPTPKLHESGSTVMETKAIVVDVGVGVNSGVVVVDEGTNAVLVACVTT
jgi:hypothetical protein